MTAQEIFQLIFFSGPTRAISSGSEIDADVNCWTSIKCRSW